ncbi:MAG: FAD binding domain-containing protein [Proteobacteria bacterium]|nr:FAD binding domain-containing protein [Pseudomonadota bacterium]
MKAAIFDYVRPRDLAEAARLLADAKGGAKLLAGGQSLGPMLNLRLARPRLLVDVARLGELRGIEARDSAWRIGGGVTHAQIEDAAGRLPGAEVLCAVAAGIAYRAVRNRGTIGGSLAHADPAADWPLALAALGADIEICGISGARTVAADRFMKGAFTVDLAEDEVVAAVSVPKLSGGARWGYYKFCRKTGEFPEASAAALFDAERRSARVFIGALSGAPQRIPALAAAIAERGAAACTREATEAAVTAAAPDLDVIDRRMHAAVLLRALQQVVRA